MNQLYNFWFEFFIAFFNCIKSNPSVSLSTSTIIGFAPHCVTADKFDTQL